MVCNNLVLNLYSKPTLYLNKLWTLSQLVCWEADCPGARLGTDWVVLISVSTKSHWFGRRKYEHV